MASMGTFNKKAQLSLADKPARRENMPKIAPIRRAYNVVANNSGLIFIRSAVVASEICDFKLISRSSILVSIESAHSTS